MGNASMTPEEIASFKKQYTDEGADPNEVKSNGNSLLMEAVLDKNYAKAKILVDAGADTCFKKQGGPSVLDHAISQADIPMIQLLLENGASFVLHDSFITAIDEKNVTIIPELITLGANVNTPDSNSTYPIMRAISNRNFEIFKLLSEHGANLNITDIRGETPLILSTRIRTLPMTKYLVQKKVDLDRRNMKDESALSVALDNNDFVTVTLLLESGAKHDLAGKTIRDKIKTNPSFRDYMIKMQKKLLLEGGEKSDLARETSRGTIARKSSIFSAFTDKRMT